MCCRIGLGGLAAGQVGAVGTKGLSDPLSSATSMGVGTFKHHAVSDHPCALSDGEGRSDDQLRVRHFRKVDQRHRTSPRRAKDYLLRTRYGCNAQVLIAQIVPSTKLCSTLVPVLDNEVRAIFPRLTHVGRKIASTLLCPQEHDFDYGCGAIPFAWRSVAVARRHHLILAARRTIARLAIA